MSNAVLQKWFDDVLGGLKCHESVLYKIKKDSKGGVAYDIPQGGVTPPAGLGAVNGIREAFWHGKQDSYEIDGGMVRFGGVDNKGYLHITFEKVGNDGVDENASGLSLFSKASNAATSVWSRGSRVIGTSYPASVANSVTVNQTA